MDLRRFSVLENVVCFLRRGPKGRILPAYFLMKNPLRPITLSVFTLVAIFIGFLPWATVHAQSPAARTAFEAAGDLYMQGDYEAALAAYQQMLKDYPTDFLVPSATVQTGFANFFLGNFADAITILEKAQKDPTTPEELKPLIAAFVPQVYAAKASAMDMGDAGRKAAFETAIAKFSEFIKAFPQSPQVESARYGQALSRFQIQDFDGTVADLEENINSFRIVRPFRTARTFWLWLLRLWEARNCPPATQGIEPKECRFTNVPRRCCRESSIKRRTSRW
jgi:outer membrane protein assembly factor BamD (BamD/ComL family)